MTLAIFTDILHRFQSRRVEAQLKHMQMQQLPHLAQRHSSIREKLRQSKKHGRQIIDIDPDDDQNYSQQSSAIIFLGMSLLWFGALIGAAGNIQSLINTNLSAATSTITWVILEWSYERKYSLVGMCVGTLCGLVGISPGSSVVPIYAAGCIGIICTLCSFFFYKIADKIFRKFDDRLGVWGCHGICGISGGICLAFFQNTEKGSNLEGIYYGGDRILGLVLAGMSCAFLWAFVMTMIISTLLYFLGLYQLIDESDNEDKDSDEQAVFLPDIDKIIQKYSNRKSLWQAKKSVFPGHKKEEEPGTMGMLPLPSNENIFDKKEKE